MFCESSCRPIVSGTRARDCVYGVRARAVPWLQCFSPARLSVCLAVDMFTDAVYAQTVPNNYSRLFSVCLIHTLVI